MLFTLLLVVLTSAFVILFSKEISDNIKKIMALPTASLLIPLLIASSCIMIFNDWVVWGVKYTQWVVITYVQMIAQWMPFQMFSLALVKIVLLVLFTIVPVFILNTYFNYKLLKKFKYGYLVSTILCVFMTTLLVS